MLPNRARLHDDVQLQSQSYSPKNWTKAVLSLCRDLSHRYLASKDVPNSQVHIHSVNGILNGKKIYTDSTKYSKNLKSVFIAKKENI